MQREPPFLLFTSRKQRRVGNIKHVFWSWFSGNYPLHVTTSSIAILVHIAERGDFYFVKSLCILSSESSYQNQWSHPRKQFWPDKKLENVFFRLPQRFLHLIQLWVISSHNLNNWKRYMVFIDNYLKHHQNRSFLTMRQTFTLKNNFELLYVRIVLWLLEYESFGIWYFVFIVCVEIK